MRSVLTASLFATLAIPAAIGAILLGGMLAIGALNACIYCAVFFARLVA